jgi:Uma2 family endonuclease
MATAIAPSTPAPAPTAPVIERLRLDFVDWATYEKFLDAVGEHHLRCTYDCGSLEIMAPLRIHEREKKLLANIVERIAQYLRVPLEPCGSMTIRREDLKKGFEPDECFYIAHAMQMVAIDEPDFTVDPPPDLAIEVDTTSSSLDRHSLYESMAIPELWRFDGAGILIFHLRSARYQAAGASLTFPFLTPADVNRYLAMVRLVPHMEILERFEAWLRTVVPPPGG